MKTVSLYIVRTYVNWYIVRRMSLVYSEDVCNWYITSEGVCHWYMVMTVSSRQRTKRAGAGGAASDRTLKAGK
jgi:hypothetical protein